MCRIPDNIRNNMDAIVHHHHHHLITFYLGDEFHESEWGVLY